MFYFFNIFLSHNACLKPKSDIFLKFNISNTLLMIEINLIMGPAFLKSSNFNRSAQNIKACVTELFNYCVTSLIFISCLKNSI